MEKNKRIDRLLGRMKRTAGLEAFLNDKRVVAWFSAIEERAIDEAMNASPGDDDARREALCVLKVVRGLRGDMNAKVRAAKRAGDELEKINNLKEGV